MSLFNALIVVVILQVLYSKIPLTLSTVLLIAAYYTYSLGQTSFSGYIISDIKKYNNNTETTFKSNFKHRSIQIYRIPDNEGTVVKQSNSRRSQRNRFTMLRVRQKTEIH